MSESFKYSYSAKNQAEVEAIRKKYLPPEEQEDKLAQLRRLDASAERPALIASLALGIVSVLVFGTGMCCFLVWNLWVLGAIACLAGAVGMLFTPQLHSTMVQRSRQKIAPQILQLTEELSRK